MPNKKCIFFLCTYKLFPCIFNFFFCISKAISRQINQADFRSQIKEINSLQKNMVVRLNWSVINMCMHSTENKVFKKVFFHLSMARFVWSPYNTPLSGKCIQQRGLPNIWSSCKWLLESSQGPSRSLWRIDLEILQTRKTSKAYNNEFMHARTTDCRQRAEITGHLDREWGHNFFQHNHY